MCGSVNGLAACSTGVGFALDAMVAWVPIGRGFVGVYVIGAGRPSQSLVLMYTSINMNAVGKGGILLTVRVDM